jgi:PIN domain nuclease of toxin-antitoxin system
MKLLLDTHTFLWFVDGNTNISSNALTLIENSSNDLYLSIASIWEIAIKVSIGKLRIAQPLEVFIPNQLSQNSISALSISVEHATHVASMEHHHRDPFDRMLVAQATVEQMPVISKDAALDAYGITRLW